MVSIKSSGSGTLGSTMNALMALDSSLRDLHGRAASVNAGTGKGMEKFLRVSAWIHTFAKSWRKRSHSFRYANSPEALQYRTLFSRSLG